MSYCLKLQLWSCEICMILMEVEKQPTFDLSLLEGRTMKEEIDAIQFQGTFSMYSNECLAQWKDRDTYWN